MAPTSPHYANPGPAAKNSKANPVKARPTSEKASTRKVSSWDQQESDRNASPQTKGFISDADDYHEFNGTEQSFAGYDFKQNEDKFYSSTGKHDDENKEFLTKNDSNPLTTQLILENENDHVQENNSITPTRENDKENVKQQKSSEEPNYKDEIEKEAVEQEKEADRMAENEEHKDDEDDDDDDNDNDDDDDDDNDDEEDDEDDDERNDNDDNHQGQHAPDNKGQKDDIYNPANQSFSVSPTVLPGMCPPCRK